MGNDNLHHKRKARQSSELKRQKTNRQPYERVLIVCEDSDSTPSYLEAIRDDLRLNPENIRILGKECGSDPKSVVKCAKENKKDYDRTYCVIDRDKHPNFSDAIQQARDNKIEMIVSIPCFEYWLLLHFEYTDRPFQAAQGSDCEEVIETLKNRFPDYKKSKDFFKQHYFTLKEKQTTAINNAKKREEMCQPKKLENPCTQMHLLVKYLGNLNQPQVVNGRSK